MRLFIQRSTVRELWDGNGDLGWSEPVARIVEYKDERCWELERLTWHGDPAERTGLVSTHVESGFGDYPYDDAETARKVGYEG